MTRRTFREIKAALASKNKIEPGALAEALGLSSGAAEHVAHSNRRAVVPSPKKEKKQTRA